MASFSIHFDGPITINHRVPVRVLGNTYEHIQRAMDRAYLLERHGAIWKHARLKDRDYPATRFIAEYPREGGIILDAVCQGADAIVDHVQSAIARVFGRALDRGLDQQASFATEIAERRAYVAQMGQRTPTFANLVQEPPPTWSAAYSDRSIVKEIDQLVGQVTPQRVEGSRVDIQLSGTVPHLPFRFDSHLARRFHIAVSKRELAAPVVVRARIRDLDAGNKVTRPNAKIHNLDTGREVVLRLESLADFYQLHPFHTAEEVRLFVSPIVEAGGFDVNGGDLQFLAVMT